MSIHLRRLSLTVALLTGAWGLILLTIGGWDFSLFGISITTNDPRRPWLLTAAALVVFRLTGGRLWPRTLGARWRAWSSIAARWAEAFLQQHFALALALSIAIGLVGFVYATRAVGGSDSYGYASEADLWLAGKLQIDQSFAKDAPWPFPERALTPVAYIPSPRDGGRSIVPMCTPGLPLLLAAAKLIGGQSLMFCVVPICGVVLVLATYGIGCRIGSPMAGLIAAWLVATSPPVLYMLMTTMTDVPVAAMCGAAFFFVLGQSWRQVIYAAALASVAILIRPNLAPLAALMALVYVLRARTLDAGARRGILEAAVFSAALVPAAAFLAILNTSLYGSPLSSGYGSAADLFVAARLGPNLRNYLGWLVDTHTPFAAAGLAALFIPLRRLWPTADRRIFIVIGAWVAVVWLMYCLWDVYDVWWFLRFLLPTWPFMMLGAAAVALALMRSLPRVLRPLLVLAVVALGGWQLMVAANRDTFVQWRGERRYVVAAQMARRLTPPNSVVFSGPHSGSVRYYGGRLTLRYDQLDPAWLDRAVAWIGSRGVHAYLLVEDWELAEFRTRFVGAPLLAALDAPPVARYIEPGRLFLFDLSEPRPASAPIETVTGVYPGLRSVPPVPIGSLHTF